MNQINTYRVRQPLLHSGHKFMPGDPIELDDDQAKGHIDKGRIDEQVILPDLPALTEQDSHEKDSSDTPPDEPLPEMPEGSYPPDSVPLPLPSTSHQAAKGTKK